MGRHGDGGPAPWNHEQVPLPRGLGGDDGVAGGGGTEGHYPRPLHERVSGLSPRPDADGVREQEQGPPSPRRPADRPGGGAERQAGGGLVDGHEQDATGGGLSAPSQGGEGPQPTGPRRP